MSTPIRVLIVDDEIAYADLLTKRMKHRGIEAKPINSGRRAVQLLREESFDVALLDLQMEEMDGIETLKMFRVIAPEMQAIILTGHGGEKEATKCIDLGAYDYLIKPCPLEKIIGQIKEAHMAPVPVPPPESH